MQRVATLMFVKRGMEERYRDEHRTIWPEVLEGIKRYGIRNYSIFMMGRELFSYFEVKDLDKAMRRAAADPVNQRWQEHMAPIMDVGAGIKNGSTIYLEEVFHTDGVAEFAGTPRRVATFMKVKQGAEAKYREEHLNVWPEILEGIREARIGNYSIYMRQRQLYSYFEVEDLDRAMKKLANDVTNQKWQEHMAPLMEVGSGVKDGSTRYLEEVFHVD